MGISGACLDVKLCSAWRLTPGKGAQRSSLDFGIGHLNVLSRTIGPIRIKFGMGIKATRLCHVLLHFCTPPRPSDSFLSRYEGLDHAEGAPTRFMVASGGVLPEEYGHGGPGVSLGDGQTEAEIVLSQGGRGVAPLRRMPPISDLT